MKYVPDAFAAPAYDRMSRLPRGIGTVSVSGTCKEAQSANSPSIRIPAGTLKKYASRPTPTTVTGRGAGADWRETETGSPEGSPAPETETTTDAVGEAWVRVTCGEDGDTVSPLVAAKVNGQTVHAPDVPTSPIATTSRRSAGVVPDDRIPASGTCSIRIAPKVARRGRSIRIEEHVEPVVSRRIAKGLARHLHEEGKGVPFLVHAVLLDRDVRIPCGPRVRVFRDRVPVLGVPVNRDRWGLDWRGWDDRG